MDDAQAALPGPQAASLSPQAAFHLGQGATGFRDFDAPPAPETNPKVCRAAWYAAARAAGGQVGDFTEQRYPWNFHRGTIDDPAGTHVALFHAQYPLIAFVDGLCHQYADEFREPPAWATALSGFGFTVLGAALLLSPLTEADTAALSAAERRQIERWKPQNIGATLFNCWD